MTRFQAVRTQCSCGITHDSKAEADYCQELQVRVRAADIETFTARPDRITLVPKRKGCKALPITWKLDFHVYPFPPDEGGDYYVDTKGCLYRKRRKLKGYRETQLKIRLWQLMGIPWELRILYSDKVEVYGGGE